MADSSPRRTRTRTRHPAAVRPDAEVAAPTKRDTVTLQWVAVGVAIVGLIVAAAVFSNGSNGGGGHGAPAAEVVLLDDA